ncbi:sugar phosphate isomerase/epimerase family protein [Paenibacillus sp. GYB003]|uniref:sugar phosphate isomerase/epimerase family protein n=1 Tax=Paenibacillus sp. GYB003 TaxID=2994392 RepID=UPI002F96AAB2
MTEATRVPAIGCCLTAGSFMAGLGGSAEADAGRDPVDGLVNGIMETLRIGYDFAELTVRSLMDLSEPEFGRLRSRLADANVNIPALNSFIPPGLKVTGPDVDEDALVRYVGLAIRRARAVGADIIVFGSGGARRVPDGFPAERAMKQVERFLAMTGDIAAEHGLTIAIEPLNRAECNLINTVEQAVRLAERARSPHIRVLADAYHMHLEREPLGVVTRAAAASLLAHVHYAESDRGFPTGAKADGIRLPELLRALREGGYTGRISAECFSADASADRSAARAGSLRYVRECLRHITTRGAN